MPPTCCPVLGRPWRLLRSSAGRPSWLGVHLHGRAAGGCCRRGRRGRRGRRRGRGWRGRCLARGRGRGRGRKRRCGRRPGAAGRHEGHRAGVEREGRSVGVKDARRGLRRRGARILRIPAVGHRGDGPCARNPAACCCAWVPALSRSARSDRTQTRSHREYDPNSNASHQRHHDGAETQRGSRRSAVLASTHRRAFAPVGRLPAPRDVAPIVERDPPPPVPQSRDTTGGGGGAWRRVSGAARRQRGPSPGLGALPAPGAQAFLFPVWGSTADPGVACGGLRCISRRHNRSS
jgi:hypothetical protein